MNGLSTFFNDQKISSLIVRGVGETSSYRMLTDMTNSNLPTCKSEFALPMIKSHPHMSKYHRYFSAIDENASVTVLIGRDAGDTMKSICFGAQAQFVHKTSPAFTIEGLVTNE